MKPRSDDACMRDRLARTLANAMVLNADLPDHEDFGWPPGEWRRRAAYKKARYYDLADRVIAIVREESA